MWEVIKKAFSGAGLLLELKKPDNITDAVRNLLPEFHKYFKQDFTYKIDISLRVSYKNGSEAQFRYPMFIAASPLNDTVITTYLQKCAEHFEERLVRNDRKLGRDRVAELGHLQCAIWECGAALLY